VGGTFVPSSHQGKKIERNRFNAVLFPESSRAVNFSEYDREELSELPPPHARVRKRRAKLVKQQN
jgi:hypothetical protein